MAVKAIKSIFVNVRTFSELPLLFCSVVWASVLHSVTFRYLHSSSFLSHSLTMEFLRTTFRNILFLIFIGVSHASTSANCSCGYIDDQGHVWRESIVTNFTKTSGALAALGNDWIVSTDNEVQSSPATANIQYVTANVLDHNSVLGIQASAVSPSFYTYYLHNLNPAFSNFPVYQWQ